MGTRLSEFSVRRIGLARLEGSAHGNIYGRGEMTLNYTHRCRASGTAKSAVPRWISRDEYIEQLRVKAGRTRAAENSRRQMRFLTERPLSIRAEALCASFCVFSSLRDQGTEPERLCKD